MRRRPGVRVFSSIFIPLNSRPVNATYILRPPPGPVAQTVYIRLEGGREGRNRRLMMRLTQPVARSRPRFAAPKFPTQDAFGGGGATRYFGMRIASRKSGGRRLRRGIPHRLRRMSEHLQRRKVEISLVSDSGLAFKVPVPLQTACQSFFRVQRKSAFVDGSVG